MPNDNPSFHRLREMLIAKARKYGSLEPEDVADHVLDLARTAPFTRDTLQRLIDGVPLPVDDLWVLRKFYKWLDTVTFRTVLREKERLRRERPDDQLFLVPDHGEDPHTRVLNRDLRAKLNGCLDALPLKVRGVMLLWSSGKTLQQIASIMGMPMGSVPRWTTRGLRLLRDCLDGKTGSGNGGRR